MSKKNRKVKKEVIYKSFEDREKEINEIKDKLKILGLVENLSRITNIFEIMDTFVETGESVSGKILLNEYKKRIDYVFNGKKNIKCTLNILNVS